MDRSFVADNKWYYVATLVIVFIIAIALILYFKNAFKSSKTEKFQETNVADDKIKAKIVLYYANWCPHSVSFLPIWEQFEKLPKNSENKLDSVLIEKVLCEGDGNNICAGKGVVGFPTIILYLRDAKEQSNFVIDGDKSDDKTRILFDEDRTIEHLLDFINKNVK